MPILDARMDAPPLRRSWPLALALLGAVVLAAGWFSVHNLDVFLHARTGAWIVEHGRVPTTNVVSEVHADHPTVADKWAFQVLAHAVMDGPGPDVVIGLRLLLMGTLFGVLVLTARALGAGAWATLGALVIAAVAARSRFMFRPDLVSLVLLAVFARACLRPTLSVATMGALVLLQVVWVNVHGYFIQGPMLVGAAALGHALAGRRAWARRGLGLVLLLALACFVNPSGWRGVAHPFEILLDLRAHYEFYTRTIVEFAPTLAPDWRGPWDRRAFGLLAALTLVVLGLGAAAALVARTRRGHAPSTTQEARGAARAAHGPAPRAVEARPGRAEGLLSAWVPGIAIVLLVGSQAFSLRRNMAPFAVVAAPLVAAGLTRWGPRGALGPVLAAALALLVVVGEQTDAFSVHDGLDRRAGHGLSEIAYPLEGIAFVAEHLPDERVFAAFSFGSTFSGLRAPRQHALIDGNTHGYPTAFLIEAAAALSGEDPDAFDRLVDAHDVTVAMPRVAGPLAARLLREEAWTLVKIGRREAVYVRRDAVDPAWLARHDLEARLRAGEIPAMAGTPPPTRWLGLRCAWRPIAERDQAALLLAGGFASAARARVEAGLAHAPDDPESLALLGLVHAAQGRVAEARATLTRARDALGASPTAAIVERTLARLDVSAREEGQ